MTRSNAREIVANLIYEMNFTQDSADAVVDLTMEPVYYDTLGQESAAYAEKPSAQLAYIRDAVRGIREKREELDGYLSKYAINWSVSRISKVARAILHVAMYEALYVDDVPVDAAISEAVELTRKYEDEDVVAFVNGILGSFVRGEDLPDDDTQADCYLWTVARLEQAGYGQYEISNFAKRGYQSRHNMKYWMGRPYMGLGVAAHSDFGGRRYSFVSDLDAYIQGMLSGDEVVDESEKITRRERGSEYLMLRLRTVHGIDEWEYRREYMMNFDPIEAKLSEFEQKGWARRQGRRWQFTPEGFLLSNQLIGQLLELQENATLGGTLDRIRQKKEEG